jgi:hypothetical protein
MERTFDKPHLLVKKMESHLYLKISQNSAKQVKEKDGKARKKRANGAHAAAEESSFSLVDISGLQTSPNPISLPQNKQSILGIQNSRTDIFWAEQESKASAPKKCC